MSPMCQYSAADEGPDTGVAGDWHFAHQAARAVGGAGLIFTKATAVNPEGRISPGDVGLWNDRQQQGLARITTFLHEHGSVPGIQLAHAGRKASTEAPWRGGRSIDPDLPRGWRPVAPSPSAFRDGDPVPAGGIAPGALVTTGPGYQVPFAAQIKAETDLAVAAVGEITEPRQAEEIVASGQADAVLLARALLRDPYWPNHAARELGAEHSWPNQYQRAF